MTGLFTLLLAGSFFLPCGRVKEGVQIDGVAVGGMSYSAAELLVREKLKEEREPLVIHTPLGDYTFCSELTYSDDVSELLRRAKKGESLTSAVTREWADAEEELAKICEENAKEGRCAEVTFSVEGFCYAPEEDALVCDYTALLRDTCAVLSEGGRDVTLHTYAKKPAVTEQILRERTRLLSCFTTHFDGANRVRSDNIRLAASRIAGTEIEAGGEFSFNAVVGKRTKENGFGEATVIFDGEFVQGVGGGVCQASTTLFNAALKAGLTVLESHNHSLSVSYVSPSLDAMVSEYSDLKIKNEYPYPVYLLSRTGESFVTFEIYGAPDGRRYETESVVLRTVAPQEPKTVEGKEERWIRAEKQGMVSESYLLCYSADGTLLSRTMIRRDHYAALQGIYALPPAEEQPTGEPVEEPHTDEPALPPEDPPPTEEEKIEEIL